LGRRRSRRRDRAFQRAVHPGRGAASRAGQWSTVTLAEDREVAV